MREPIPYLQWKERIDAQIPDDCRVGNDFLIVKKPRETDLVDQPFRLDMTLSVFLATGHCTFMADLTIQQIADRLHFPSQSVFGKFFKRVTGLSPRAYRQQHSHL